MRNGGLASVEQDAFPPDLGDRLVALLRAIVTAPGFRERLQRVDQIILFELREPEMAIAVDVRRGSSFSVTQDGAMEHPDLTMRLTTSDAARLFLGKFNPFLGQDEGSLQIAGDPRHFFATIPLICAIVAPLFRQMVGPPYYPSEGVPLEKFPPGALPPPPTDPESFHAKAN